MQCLLNLPERGAFGVVEGVRPLPAHAGCSNGYVCVHDTQPPAGCVVSNAMQDLRDLYRAAARRHAAAAAASAAKRARQPTEARPGSKRPKTHAGGSPAAAAAGAADGSRQPLRPLQLQAPPAAPQQQPQGAAAVGTSGRPGAGVAMAAASAAGRNGIACSSSRQAVFTLEQLKARTNKELVELLKARGCSVSGKKDELLRRLLDYQRRVKKAAQASGGSAQAAAAAAGGP